MTIAGVTTVVTTSLVVNMMLAEAAALAVLFAAVLVHALLLARRDRLDARRLRRAGPALARALADDDAAPVAELVEMPARLREDLIAHIASNLRGAQHERLARQADGFGLRAHARRRARSRLWWRRLHGANLLTRVFDGDPLLPAMLDDRNPVVRSEAIIWAGDHIDDDIADRLVTHLADPSLLCRETAAETLRHAGPAATARVAAGLAQPAGPSLPELLDIAAAVPAPPYLAAALDLAHDPRPRVRAGAARLLASLGGDLATTALTVRLADPAPLVREAAATGLGRLGHWPAAPVIAPLLRDRTWDVRRAAGEALALLGAPGALLLARYARDADPYAADMAQRISLTWQATSARGVDA